MKVSLQGLGWFYRRYSEWKELYPMRQAPLALILALWINHVALDFISPEEVHSCVQWGGGLTFPLSNLLSLLLMQGGLPLRKRADGTLHTHTNWEVKLSHFQLFYFIQIKSSFIFSFQWQKLTMPVPREPHKEATTFSFLLRTCLEN